MKLAFGLAVFLSCAVACVPGRPDPAVTAALGTTPNDASSADDPNAPGIPSSLLITEGVPPVEDQGSPGSCYAWAAGYYYLTHLQWREYGWDVADPENQCSPAFVYHLTNGGTNEVTARGDFERENAFRLFETMGCSSMADMPFVNYDLLSLPPEAAFRNGMRFRTRATGQIDVRTDEGIARLKAHLIGGDWPTSAFSDLKTSKGSRTSTTPTASARSPGRGSSGTRLWSSDTTTPGLPRTGGAPFAW